MSSAQPPAGPPQDFLTETPTATPASNADQHTWAFNTPHMNGLQEALVSVRRALDTEMPEASRQRIVAEGLVNALTHLTALLLGQ